MSGQDEYKQMREEQMGSVDGVLLVYSIADVTTMEDVETLYEAILANNTKLKMVLTGNKVLHLDKSLLLF